MRTNTATRPSWPFQPNVIRFNACQYNILVAVLVIHAWLKVVPRIVIDGIIKPVDIP